MSFRGIWIIARDSRDKGHVLLSRKYPTVERRFQLIHGETDANFPDDTQFVKCLFSKLEIGRKNDEFIEEHDSCVLNKEEPVVEVDVNGQKLWPIVVLQKSNVLFACLGLVESKAFDGKTPLVEIPAISIGYALLHNIVDFVDLSPGISTQVASQIEEVGSLLKILMPFGTPTDNNLNTMKLYVTGKDIGWIPKYKLSAWRPVAHKVKNQLHLNVRERVSAAIYKKDKTVFKDMCHTYGTVSCKADVEGVPEVSVNLVSKPNIHMVFHPCLQSVDFVSGKLGSLGNPQPEFYRGVEQAPVSRNVRFTPPVEQFPLCHYNGDTQLPINGIFQFGEEKGEIIVQVQLELNSQVKNSFEYIEVHIPIFHRAPINKLDYRLRWGTVLVSPDRRTLVWSIGPKFPKALRVRFRCTVLLAEPASAEKSNFKEDPFCQGLNTYMQIFFKTTNFTLSDIDPKSVQINPSSNTKIHIAQELISVDYKIWNIDGDAIVAFPPTL